MPAIHSSLMPLPSNWQDFETIVQSALKIREKNNSFSKNGRVGQKQHGVDIFASVNGVNIGAQCKLTFNSISESTIKFEIDNATNFTPKLNQLLICTTSPRDANLQRFVWNLNLDFTVNILFWDDITSELEKDMNVFNIHFPYCIKELSSEENFYHDYRNIIEYVIQTDPCGSPIHIRIVTDLNYYLQKWRMPDLYSNDMTYKNLQLSLLDNLHKWIEFMSPFYMHDIWDGNALFCNVNSFRNLEEMRSAMTIIRKEIYDDFYKLLATGLI